MSSYVGGPKFRPANGLVSERGAGLVVQPPLNRLWPTQPVNRAEKAGGAPPFADSETFRWVRRAVAVAVPILAVNTIFTTFADNMPAFHHVAALVAVPVMVAAWVVELSGVRWPRLVLIAAIGGPNLYLALIGHTETNYLFLSLLVGWVAFTGTRAEGLIALALAFATISLGVILYVAPAIGAIPWELWTEWSFSLLLTWFLPLSLRRQERLVAALDERSQELAMLLTVSGSVASTLEMRPLLDTVFDALATVLDYSAIAILTLNEKSDTLTFAHMRGPGAHLSQELKRVSYPVADFGIAWDRLCHDEPVVIPDVRNTTAKAGPLLQVADDERVDDSIVRSLIWIPLVVRQQIIGILSIANATPNAFSDRDTTLALGIARQAAVAIENARLHERARQVAVLEERQRLARELHDSVTQSLYGISLYAEAAGRALTDGDTEPAVANLHEISDTTHEALGEMRLLLFELRPPLLQEQGLAAALQARLKAVEARASLATEFESDGTEVRRLAPNIEQELYRLTQEALNNVLKHAHAQRVKVRLEITLDRTVLEIADDGVGFQPALRGADGFGLPGMRERAERLGGALQVDSAPGAGTRVRVEVAC